MKDTSYQMIGRYIQEHEYIVPAHLLGTYYIGKKWSSELSRRCRQMVKWKILIDDGKEGRCERFRLNPKLLRRGKTFFVNQDYTEILEREEIKQVESREESKQIALQI